MRHIEVYAYTVNRRQRGQESNAAFTLGGFDDQERNLTFVKQLPSFKIKIYWLQYEASFLSTLQTKYCASLTSRKYFFASFPFGIWLSNLHVSTRHKSVVVHKKHKCVVCISMRECKFCHWFFSICWIIVVGSLYIGQNTIVLHIMLFSFQNLKKYVLYWYGFTSQNLKECIFCRLLVCWANI